jgi:hypothetical protein
MNNHGQSWTVSGRFRDSPMPGINRGQASEGQGAEPYVDLPFRLSAPFTNDQPGYSANSIQDAKFPKSEFSEKFVCFSWKSH